MRYSLKIVVTFGTLMEKVRRKVNFFLFSFKLIIVSSKSVFLPLVKKSVTKKIMKQSFVFIAVLSLSNLKA